MTEDEQQEVVRYWVVESIKANRHVALIRTFENHRKEYVASKPDPDELKDPAYNPVGRVTFGLLKSALDANILFLDKAFDTDKKSANLLLLKNEILKNPSIQDDNRAIIIKEFRRITASQKQAKKIVGILRNKLVAHVDLDFLVHSPQENLGLERFLAYVEKTVQLVSLIAAEFKTVGTIEKPAVSDNSLVISPIKMAELDADEFWRVTFGCWAF